MERLSRSAQSFIKVLQGLEPLFRRAGDLACTLQKTARSRMKLATGNYSADVVTEADIEVQEFILKAMLDTSLRACLLFAEEETPSAKKFPRRGPYRLTLDPIDGTGLYAKGKKLFSIIVGLHDARGPLYTFKHYPAVRWTHIICGDEYRVIGRTPRIPMEKVTERTIAFSLGNPEEEASELVKTVTARSYQFKRTRELTDDAGATTLFLAGKINGYYCGNPLVVDGVVSFHYARAMRHPLYTGAPRGVDFTAVHKGELGWYYRGCYLALRNSYD